MISVEVFKKFLDGEMQWLDSEVDAHNKRLGEITKNSEKMDKVGAFLQVGLYVSIAGTILAAIIGSQSLTWATSGMSLIGLMLMLAHMTYMFRIRSRLHKEHIKIMAVFEQARERKNEWENMQKQS